MKTNEVFQNQSLQLLINFCEKINNKSKFKFFRITLKEVKIDICGKKLTYNLILFILVGGKIITQ